MRICDHAAGAVVFVVLLVVSTSPGWTATPGQTDVEEVQGLLRNHFRYTRSEKADDVLRKWDAYAPKFVKVFPKDYKRALTDRLQAESGNG